MLSGIESQKPLSTSAQNYGMTTAIAKEKDCVLSNVQQTSYSPDISCIRLRGNKRNNAFYPAAKPVAERVSELAHRKAHSDLVTEMRRSSQLMALVFCRLERVRKHRLSDHRMRTHFLC